MAGGIYNETYFRNYPEEKERDGILYGIVLVNMKTWERETMEKVLADIDKVIIDKESGSGVVPYLPLPELKKGSNN